jgi:hypothetical protein
VDPQDRDKCDEIHLDHEGHKQGPAKIHSPDRLAAERAIRTAVDWETTIGTTLLHRSLLDPHRQVLKMVRWLGRRLAIGFP